MDQLVYAANAMVEPIKAEPSDTHIARGSATFLTLFADVQAGASLTSMEIEHTGLPLEMRLHFFAAPPALDEGAETFAVEGRFGVADVTLTSNGSMRSGGSTSLGFGAPDELPDGVYVMGEARSVAPVMGGERFDMRLFFEPAED